MDVYLIRHTSLYFERPVWYGQADVPVNEATFPAEAAKVRDNLPLHDEAIVISSPLSRARRLAEVLHPEPQLDDRLMEIFCGNWELMPFDAIGRDKINAWRRDFVNRRTGDGTGESYRMVYDRIRSFWDELHKLNTPQVVIVAHGGVISCILTHVAGNPLNTIYDLKVDYGGISKLTYCRSCRSYIPRFINRHATPGAIKFVK